MKRQKYKLFVWVGFCPDYTDGLAFAIATDETEARELIRKTHQYEPIRWGELTIHEIEPIAFSVCGGG